MTEPADHPVYIEAHPGPYPPGAQPVNGAWSRSAWLPILGPSAWVLWVELTRDVEAGPITTTAAELAARVGLHLRRLHRTLGRLERFRFLDQPHPDCYRVHTLARPLGRRLQRRHSTPTVASPADPGRHDGPDSGQPGPRDNHRSR